jgi:hypothetical protein
VEVQENAKELQESESESGTSDNQDPHAKISQS